MKRSKAFFSLFLAAALLCPIAAVWAADTLDASEPNPVKVMETMVESGGGQESGGDSDEPRIIEVNNNWTNGGPTQYRPDVQYQLYRQSENEALLPVGGPLTLNFDDVTDFNSLPKFDADGDLYKYSLVPLTYPANYTVSIDTNKEGTNLDIYLRYNDRNMDDPIFPIDLTGTHVKYIVGYPDDSVQAEGALTRAEAATMFAKLLANQLGETIHDVSVTGFTDSENTWYTDYVSYMKSKNVIGGYQDGTFRPDAKITRAEFATMVAKLMNRTGIPTPFIDTFGHWAEKNLEAAYKAAVISGDPNGKFRPDENIKRVEAASILNVVFNRAVDAAGFAEHKSSIEAFTDLKEEFWGYLIMVEATNSHEFERPATTMIEKWTKLVK